MKSHLSVKRRVYGMVLKGIVLLCAGITVSLLAAIIGYVFFEVFLGSIR